MTSIFQILIVRGSYGPISPTSFFILQTSLKWTVMAKKFLIIELSLYFSGQKYQIQIFCSLLIFLCEWISRGFTVESWLQFTFGHENLTCNFCQHPRAGCRWNSTNFISLSRAKRHFLSSFPFCVRAHHKLIWHEGDSFSFLLLFHLIIFSRDVKKF